jgi:ataxia telangiectasia mutated family protein
LRAQVIPLTPSAGVVEWVMNTIPLGEYLIGPPRDPSLGAHVRFRPQDMKSLDARRQLQVCVVYYSKKRDHRLLQAATDEYSKLQIYEQIQAQLKPVFHHFFLEKFPNPADWFERRLTYTRSVASNSMVGYIVGLGDRHAQNILIDQHSAELIRISFHPTSMLIHRNQMEQTTLYAHYMA